LAGVDIARLDNNGRLTYTDNAYSIVYYIFNAYIAQFVHELANIVADFVKWASENLPISRSGQML